MQEILDQLKDAMNASDERVERILGAIHKMDWKFYDEDNAINDALADMMQRRDARREILRQKIEEIKDEVTGQVAQERHPPLPPIGDHMAVGEHFNDNVEPLPQVFAKPGV